MGKDWQLLGEVPDSDDDDGLDSQESLADNPVEQDLFLGDLSDGDTIVPDARANPRAAAEQPSLPSSPPLPATPLRQRTPSRQIPPPLITQESSTLSSLSSFHDDDEIDLVDGGLLAEDESQYTQARSPAAAEPRHDDSTGQKEGQDSVMGQETPRPKQPPSQAPRPVTPHSSQTPRQALLSEASQPGVPQDTADPFSWSPTSSLSSLSRSPSPLLPEPSHATAAAAATAAASTLVSENHRASSPPFEFPVIPDSPHTFRLGFVRSLRPRKPIQQHPYLLENAKYTHEMKRHGMKPVRTEYNPSARRPPANGTEEDSQEQYAEQETQLPSQPEVFSDPAFIDDDLYAFPSSPPTRGERLDRPEPPSLSPSTSTPAHRLLFPTSSQGRADDGTDNPSMAEEDDFPNPATYFQERRKRQLFERRAGPVKSTKRQGTPLTSSAAKRARLLDAALQSGAQTTATTPPRAKWIPVPFSSSPDPLPRPSGRMRVIRSSSPPTIPSPPPPMPRQITPFTIPDDLSEDESEAGEPEEGDGGENDADTVRQNSRRIKGVLPASWLRLDKQNTARPGNDKPLLQRRPGLPADNAPRRGVALPRQGTGPSSFAALASIFDESDDENEPTTSMNNNNSNNHSNDNDNDTTHNRQIQPKITTADLWSEETDDDDDGLPVYHHIIDDDDIGPSMEANVLDRMESGPSRSRSSNTGPRAQPRKLSRNPSFTNSLGSTPSQKTRQPKIDRIFDRTAASSIAHNSRKPAKKPSGLARIASTKSASSSKPRTSGQRAASGTGAAKRTRRPRPPATPPLLSILDFVEPHASGASGSGPQRMRQPDFIRVAARTARKSHTLGKASPSRKVINLGSRADNVDALSVMQDWRASKIQPRIPNPPRMNKPRKRPAQSGRPAATAPHHPPLHEISANLPRQPSSLKAVVSTQPAPRRPAKKQYVNRIAQARPAASRQLNSATMRPAQLETAVRSNTQSTAGFVAKKRALDEMYRQRQKEAAIRPSLHLEQFIDDQASNYGSVDAMELDDFEQAEPREALRTEQPRAAPSKTPRSEAAERSRFRKRYNPQPVDISAPRFVHALDPLPVNISPHTIDLEADSANVEPESDKLRGLGPYGSQYSQHFDIFPLDSGVFFHKSTILGSGRLSTALGTHLAADAPTATPVYSFQLDERTLSWNAWDDVTSSELGILMDWLADSLFSPPATNTLFKVHALVDFILDFIQTTVFAPITTSDVRKAFVLRTMEVVSSFVKRFESASVLQPEAERAAVSNAHLASSTGTVALMSWLLRICRNTPECKVYSFQVEDLLTRVAKVSARALLKHGLDDVRASYDEFQRPSRRARGIRRDQQALCSWVVLVKVLEHAQVPRGGFWDVTYWAMYGSNKDKSVAIHTTTDVSRLEQLWEDMFTLLPLTEFDSTGMVQAGIRQSMPVDGWELPKKVLDRVFQVYKANPHQSPSFNAYCRAQVGRCHYLVQEWGWRSCKTVIGTIFDFYGSQDFAHLRNEEVYSSPRFLDELASGRASRAILAIAPEDKCFHIFIKMLGLVILELKRLGRAKEMTNLVARILPNHDRQYLKEVDVHQRDLAALRNHHDLLCTLYWAASPEVRPPIHQIEKLVEPSNSHKEACLINIRAWNQLARFVIANNEGYGVYRAFVVWMRNIFNSMLEQYQSAESDMHRQFQNLSKSMMQGIGPDMVKAMALANQAAAMDILQACAAASFDVMQQAKTLGVATYCLSTDQLDSIFSKLDLASSKCSNWTIFQTALDVLDHYMQRIDAVMDAQYASLNSNTNVSGDGTVPAVPDAAEADEAVMLLDHSVAKGLFRLISTITHMSWDGLPPSVVAMRVACTERSVLLAARLASRFVHAGMYNLSRFFGGSGGSGGSDNYCIFERLPHAPGLEQRRFLPLFLSGLVGNNVFDLKDLGGTNMLEQWLLAVAKPARFLGYENRLARVLQQHNLPYLRRANIPSSVQAVPTYDTNRAYFACAMVAMRQQLRDSEDGAGGGSGGGAAARRQQLRGEFARALRLVMQQIKDDLRLLSRSSVAAAAAAHAEYVLFVRAVVALMRSHGGDICTLDDFFYSQSVEYVPSPEDPQLRAASIVTYGLRLGEGEATAAPQLFYYLHNSFNIALANGDLARECRLLERSMNANSSILDFVLARMLPAILRVSMSSAGSAGTASWPLLDVYCSAVEQFLTRSIAPQAVDDTVLAGAVAGLFQDIVQLLVYAFGGMGGGHNGVEHAEHAEDGEVAAAVKVRVRTMAQLAALVNVLRPLIMACVCLPACSDETRTQLDGAVAALYELVRVYGDARTSQGELLSAIVNGRSVASTQEMDMSSGMSSGMPCARSPQVAQFTASIAKHVIDNWMVEADGSIHVKRTSAAGAAAAMAGHVPFSWTMDELLDELRRQLGLWTLLPVQMRFPRPGSRRRLFPGRLRAGVSGRL